MNQQSKVVYVHVKEVAFSPPAGVRAELGLRMTSQTDYVYVPLSKISDSSFPFRYTDYQTQSIGFILNEVAPNQREIGRLTVPLKWIQQNAVVLQDFPFKMKITAEQPIFITMGIHISENGAPSFSAPPGSLLVKPAWNTRFPPQQVAPVPQQQPQVVPTPVPHNLPLPPPEYQVQQSAPIASYTTPQPEYGQIPQQQSPVDVHVEQAPTNPHQVDIASLEFDEDNEDGAEFPPKPVQIKSPPQVRVQQPPPVQAPVAQPAPQIQQVATPYQYPYQYPPQMYQYPPQPQPMMQYPPQVPPGYQIAYQYQYPGYPPQQVRAPVPQPTYAYPGYPGQVFMRPPPQQPQQYVYQYPGYPVQQPQPQYRPMPQQAPPQQQPQPQVVVQSGPKKKVQTTKAVQKVEAKTVTMDNDRDTSLGVALDDGDNSSAVSHEPLPKMELKSLSINSGDSSGAVRNNDVQEHLVVDDGDPNFLPQYPDE